MVFASFFLILGAVQDAPATSMILVVGNGGEPAFARQFATWADRWENAAQQGKVKCERIGPSTDKPTGPPTGEPTNPSAGERSAESTASTTTSDRSRLQALLDETPAKSTEPLWLVLIGHGTYDGKDAKFNLRGPDFSAAELANWLARLARPVVVINCASSSGPFINGLSGPGRLIVTASKSGYQRSFARLGDALSSAISDVSADLDKDGQTSLLEAFLIASKRTGEFYEQSSRLATEHALLDDNGDGLGTTADFFRGVRAVKTAQDGASPDGAAAAKVHLILSDLERKLSPELRARRDEIEKHVEQLRAQKQDFPADEYYARLETLMLELAKIYH